jgi:hypothetical protein
MIQNVAVVMPVVSFAMVVLVVCAIAAAGGSLQDCGSEAVVHDGRATAMRTGTSGSEAKEENKVEAPFVLCRNVTADLSLGWTIVWVGDGEGWVGREKKTRVW